MLKKKKKKGRKKMVKYEGPKPEYVTFAESRRSFQPIARNGSIARLQCNFGFMNKYLPNGAALYVCG